MRYERRRVVSQIALHPSSWQLRTRNVVLRISRPRSVVCEAAGVYKEITRRDDLTPTWRARDISKHFAPRNSILPIVFLLSGTINSITVLFSSYSRKYSDLLGRRKHTVFLDFDTAADDTFILSPQSSMRLGFGKTVRDEVAVGARFVESEDSEIACESEEFCTYPR